jgi:hypothetical protein
MRVQEVVKLSSLMPIVIGWLIYLLLIAQSSASSIGNAFHQNLASEGFLPGREYVHSNQVYRQINGAGAVPSRIKPPSDISSMIGKRPSSTLPRNEKPGEISARSSNQIRHGASILDSQKHPNYDHQRESEMLDEGQSSENRGSQSIRQKSHDRLKQVENHPSISKNLAALAASPKISTIQKQLFTHPEENMDSREHNTNGVQSPKFHGTVRRKRLDESASEDFTASTAYPETPIARSGEDREQTRKAAYTPTTARPDRVVSYRALDEPYPAAQNFSNTKSKLSTPRTKENSGNPGSNLLTIPLKLKQDFSSPTWQERKDQPYDHEAYELLNEARNELHDMKERWKEAVLASRSVSNIKLELSAAQESAKEVLELRRALSQAYSDKENLTVELRRVAIQYDILSQQYRDSDAKCRELDESRTKVKEQYEAAIRQADNLRKAVQFSPLKLDETSENGLEKLEKLKERVEGLESELSAARADREDLAMECDDLRRFTDTLQIAATDAEQVSIFR